MSFLPEKITIKDVLCLSAIFLIIIFCLLGVMKVISDRNDVANRLLNSVMEIKTMTAEKKAIYYDDYLNKCLLGRMVYQFSWYVSKQTKLGKLNVDKHYAMSAEEFNDMIEKSWEYNRMLSIPIDSWENYIPLANWTFESGICEWREHSTGEIIRMAGFTEEGFRTALYYYIYESGIQPGHPWYIPELFGKRLSVEEISKIFSTWRPVLKFYYAYISRLLSQYDYKWNWALTAFHFGLEKPDYWWYDKNLKEVPNYRLDGQWQTLWLRKYYETVYEIAHSYATGRLQRISLYEKTVGDFGKWNQMNNDYLWTLKLKFRVEEKQGELKRELVRLTEKVNGNDKLYAEILSQVAKLNDFTLESREARGQVSRRSKMR